MTSVKAIETTATVDEQGHLALDTPLTITQNRRVRVIVLVDEDEEDSLDDTPTEEALAGLRQGLHEALTGQTLPLTQIMRFVEEEHSEVA